MNDDAPMIAAATPDSRSAIARDVIAFLRLLPSAPAVGAMTHDTALLSSGLLDSLGILELTTFLSAHFSIEIGDEDFTTANFGTIGDLVRFVDSKQIPHE